MPDVTYTDFGKRLTVSSNGVWSAYPTFFHGNGAPSSNLGNCVGDIYYDDLNGYTYVCTKYVSIPEHFTTLAGLSITMKSQVNFESAEGLTNFTYKCHETPPNSSMGTLVWYDGSTEPYYSYKCSGLTTNGLSVVINGWSWGAWSVDFTHGTSSYQNVPFYRNSTSNKQTIIFPNTFDEDTGTEPQDVIDFFINNAFSINNLGATWTMVIDGRLPAPPSMDDDILVGNNGSWVLNSSVHQNGVVFDRNPNNQNSNYNRSIPGNSFDVYNNSIMSISLDGNSKDVCWTTASNVQSLKRHAFKTLMNDKDASITSITSNESLSHWKYCQPGCYGYIGDSVASTLQGCPTTTAFVMVSTVLNRAYYYTSPNLNSLNSSYIIRYIFTWDGKIYKQNVQVDNMANYTYGNWYRITTSEEVPDAPTIDGNYVLKCSVSSGVPTYAWDAV